MSEYNIFENLKCFQIYFKFLFVCELLYCLLFVYEDKFFGKNRFYINGFWQLIVKVYRFEDVEDVSMVINNVIFVEFFWFIVIFFNYFVCDDYW